MKYREVSFYRNATDYRAVSLLLYELVNLVSDWFFTEILLDVIQYCEFVTKQQDEVIIYQGERGHT